jgi:RNA polymerase sigma-70 factor (ECF subfamily)
VVSESGPPSQIALVGPAEWAPLLAAEVDYVNRTLRHLGAGASELDDLLQEVFLVMCRQRAQYDARRPLRPWIVGVVFRVLQESRRRRWRSPPAFIDTPEEPPSPEQQLISAETRALVLSALERLSRRHRALLVMHEMEEVPVRDLASTLSLPQNTLYSRLKRARLLFAREIRRRDLKRVRLTSASAAPA